MLKDLIGLQRISVNILFAIITTNTRQTCYQIHGFSSTKIKRSASPSSSVVVAAVSNNSNQQPLLPSLSADQYSRFIAMLSTDVNETPPWMNLTGPAYESDDHYIID